MIETLAALNEYFDMLLLEPTTGVGAWCHFRVVAIKGDLTIEEQGSKLEEILQKLLITTLRQAK